MSAYWIDKLVHLAGSPDGWRAFVADPQARLANADLTDAERDALLAVDLVRLYELGANEYLLLRLGGWNGRRAPEELAAAQGAAS